MRVTNDPECFFKLQTIWIGGERQYIDKKPVREFIASILSDPMYIEQGNCEPLFYLFHPKMILNGMMDLSGFKTIVKINPLIK